MIHLLCAVLLASALAVPASLGNVNAPIEVEREASSSSSSSTVSLPQLKWDGYVTWVGSDFVSFTPASSWVTGFDLVDSAHWVYTNIPWVSSYAGLPGYLWVDGNEFQLGIAIFLGPSSTAFQFIDDFPVGYHHVRFATYANAFDYGTVTGNIGAGMGLTGGLASIFNDAVSGLFYHDGALTNVGVFAFTLLGLGIAVSTAALCFHWVTGRHGM